MKDDIKVPQTFTTPQQPDIIGDINGVPTLLISDKDEASEDPVKLRDRVRLPVKVKVEVLAPDACVTETHEIEYKPAYYAGRFYLTIDKYQYMVTGNGKDIYKLGKVRTNGKEQEKTQ